ncbi:hypothetical protein Tsubulata_014109 [Turnera subulata]|uniref:Uncharacterized protein n=1 Tax=Turnera subulata TaxID=218843 RepID=A0A9Q0JM92_9ROSI|nr:hypothetical protein Tsubulata_014109 [Turnera subulata]
MPLYDCVMLFKPQVKFESVMDLMARVGRHVCRRNGVITDVKTSRTVQLGYGVRKLDGRYYQVFKISMSGPTDADDNDGHTQHQQGAAVPEQGGPLAEVDCC